MFLIAIIELQKFITDLLNLSICLPRLESDKKGVQIQCWQSKGNIYISFSKICDYLRLVAREYISGVTVVGGGGGGGCKNLL